MHGGLRRGRKNRGAEFASISGARDARGNGLRNGAGAAGEDAGAVRRGDRGNAGDEDEAGGNGARAETSVEEDAGTDAADAVSGRVV